MDTSYRVRLLHPSLSELALLFGPASALVLPFRILTTSKPVHRCRCHLWKPSHRYLCASQLPYCLACLGMAPIYFFPYPMSSLMSLLFPFAPTSLIIFYKLFFLTSIFDIGSKSLWHISYFYLTDDIPDMTLLFIRSLFNVRILI